MTIAVEAVRPRISDYYKPFPKQETFHRSPAKYRLFGGAAGPGKTKALLWEAIYQANEIPGCDTLLLRRTYPELEASLLTQFRRDVPRSLYRTFNESKHLVTWHNGSTTKFGYCRIEKDVYQYQGGEYLFIGLDELTFFTLRQWQFLTSRNRCPVPGSFPNMAGASNPGNIGHAWVKSLWIDEEAPGTCLPVSTSTSLTWAGIRLSDPNRLAYSPGGRGGSPLTGDSTIRALSIGIRAAGQKPAAKYSLIASLCSLDSLRECLAQRLPNEASSETASRRSPKRLKRFISPLMPSPIAPQNLVSRSSLEMFFLRMACHAPRQRMMIESADGNSCTSLCSQNSGPSQEPVNDLSTASLDLCETRSIWKTSPKLTETIRPTPQGMDSIRASEQSGSHLSSE